MFTFIYSLLIAASSVVVPVEIQKLDGATLGGRLSHIATTSVHLQAAKGRVEIPLTAIQKINFANQVAHKNGDGNAWIRLVDGTLLVAAGYSSSANQAHIHMTDGSDLQIETRHVRSVRFKQQDRRQRRQWDDILRAGVRGDLIVIRKQDRIDYLEGVLGNVDAKAVRFQLDDELIPVRRGKVEGIVYFHASLDGLPPPVVRVTDVDGSQFAVSQWSADERGVRLQLPAGVRLRRNFDQLRQIDFSSDKIVYLSDIEPAGVDWQPYLPLKSLLPALREFYRPRRDRALGAGQREGDDGKLQLWMGQRGRSTALTFEKGLALHSRTSITYQLPAEVKYFRALAGIDARVHRHGHVRLVITGDRRELFAENIAGTQPPREIALNIAGVSVLKILVDFGENQDIGDHLNLCNARLIK